MKKCISCKINFDPKGREGRCSDCKRQYDRDYYAKHKSELAVPKSVNRKRSTERNQAFILDHLRSRACIDCGECDPVVLEFDHVRGTKVKNLSDMVLGGWSLGTIQNEIEKCDIRCANCHRRITHARRSNTI